MEKRNIRLLVSLVFLIGAVTAVLLLQTGERKVAVDPLLFRITDATAIDHVTLESKTGKIDLHFSGNRWKINEKREADEQLIKVLMATLLQVTPKRPVAKQQTDSIKSRLDSDGVKVSLFAGTELQKSFTAGGNAAKTEAYFRDDKGGPAWLMTIPGYRVYAAGIFELSENEWRDKRIFNFNWRNFRKLSLTYPKDAAASFEIARQDDFLGVVGLENPDSTRINTFLNDVLTLSADQILNAGDAALYDSIAATPPVLILTVEDIAKRTYRLEVFGMLTKGGKVPGRALENEIVLFDRKKTFPVFKKKGYFRVK